MRALILVAILMLAGCSTPSASVPPPTPARAALAFAPGIQVALDCGIHCYEPSLVADPAGRIFVSSDQTNAIAVSSDGGATWTSVATPPIGNAPLGGFGADIVLQLSPAGRLYYSALVFRNIPLGQEEGGIQIAWSDDAGKTWRGNVEVSLANDRDSRIELPDRQWLAFGEGDAMYLTYNQYIPTDQTGAPAGPTSGIWIARSTDAGKTWSGWTRAVDGADRPFILGQSGVPVVDSKGDVIVPACMDGDKTNAVFVSTDEAKTFTRHDVGPGCAALPMLSIARDGTIVAAWTDLKTIDVATSRDATAWSAPMTWASSKALEAPWMVPAANGTLAVAWYSDDGKTTDVHVSRGTLAGGPMEDVTLARGLSAPDHPRTTDYASAAQLADGRVGVVWANTTAKALWFAASMP